VTRFLVAHSAIEYSTMRSPRRDNRNLFNRRPVHLISLGIRYKYRIPFAAQRRSNFVHPRGQLVGNVRSSNVVRKYLPAVVFDGFMIN
jgi:hypothetical protein